MQVEEICIKKVMKYEEDDALRKISRQGRSYVFQVGERGGEKAPPKYLALGVGVNERTQGAMGLRKPSARKQGSAQG